MTGTSEAVQDACRTSTYRPYRPSGRKAKYGRFSVLPRPEIYRNLRIKDSVKIDPPYNTGNEGWVYNDNVNDPRMVEWLVGDIATSWYSIKRRLTQKVRTHWMISSVS